jgi:hypothetical protein
MKPFNLSGRRFGKLTAVGFTDRNSTGQIRWLCRCDCGGETKVVTTMLLRGIRTQCRACSNRYIGDIRVTHGMARRGGQSTPAWRSWQAMKIRCFCTTDHNYPNYGGRGIRMCERWLDFANFLADMGERPAGTTIDRIDVNGHYEPGNCRWATPTEQSRNQRTNKLTADRAEEIKDLIRHGVKHRDIADRFGVSMGLVSLIRNGKVWR